MTREEMIDTDSINADSEIVEDDLKDLLDRWEDGGINPIAVATVLAKVASVAAIRVSLEVSGFERVDE